jgi:hypothetical protein
VFGEWCLRQSGGEAVALEPEFVGLGDLATGGRRVETKGSMGFGAVAMFNFGGGERSTRCHLD